MTNTMKYRGRHRKNGIDARTWVVFHRTRWIVQSYCECCLGIVARRTVDGRAARRVTIDGGAPRPTCGVFVPLRSMKHPVAAHMVVVTRRSTARRRRCDKCEYLFGASIHWKRT